MARGIWHLMGGGGLDPSELTAEPWAVLAPYTAGMKGMDEPGTGTMVNRGAVSQALNAGQSYTIPAGYHNGGGRVTANGLAGQTAGTAVAGDIYPGKTAWVNGVMLTGAMAVYSVVSFSIAVTGSSTVTATWVWPSRGPYSGVAINYTTDWYPTSPWDGTRAYTGTGTNHNLGAASAAAIGGLQPSTTYYFSIWVYCSTSNGDMFSGQYNAAAITTQKAQGQQIVTSSGIFTVPAGVWAVDVFLVSGGNGGAAASYPTGESNPPGGNGGGGGVYGVYTHKGIGVTPGQQINVTIGGGGTPGGTYNGPNPGYGGASSFGSYSTGTTRLNTSYGHRGGASGGGGGGKRGGANNGGNGCSDGTGTASWNKTTRAFGESNNTLYAGGGGGGLGINSSGTYGLGGAGGGGDGSGYGQSGTPNTGGGGGGASSMRSNGTECSGYGGSGVVLVRWGY